MESLMYSQRCGVVCVGFQDNGFPVFPEGIVPDSVLVINEQATFTGNTKGATHSIYNEENRGFGSAVAQGIAYLQTLGCTHYILINPDVVPAPGLIEGLLSGMKRTQADIAQPVILCPDGSINTTGNTLSYVGISTCRALGSKLLPTHDEEIMVASGACVCITKEAWERLGGFDEQLFLYHEDTDLSWRALLLGLRIVCVYDAYCTHNYELRLPAWKLGYLEKHRLHMLLKNYECMTLLVLAPVLLFLETGMCVYSIAGGWGKEKWLGYGWLWHTRRERAIQRRQVQQSRTRTDADIWKLLDKEITDPTLQTNILVRRILNPVLRIYAKGVAWYLQKRA